MPPLMSMAFDALLFRYAFSRRYADDAAALL